jgi:hypothetical protein
MVLRLAIGASPQALVALVIKQALLASGHRPRGRPDPY